MAKSGLKHIDVGAELTKTEWESEESHELLHGTSFPSSPVERQLFYRDDEHKWYIYSGSAWVWLGGGGGGMAVHGNEYHDPDFATESALTSHASAATGVHGVGAGTIAKVGDIAVDTNLSAAAQDAIAKKHTQGTDTALGAVGTKNPPIDADKALYRDSADSDALKTSTWTQIKAFLKTYFDTVYRLATADHTHQSTGAQAGKLDHGLALDGLADDDHTQYIKHSLATAVSDFLVASGAGAFVKKTLAETKTILNWAADIATHAGLTSGVHGVGGSTVESASGSQAKVDAHKDLATGVHGVGSNYVAQAPAASHLVRTFTKGWTSGKLLKGAGVDANPTEISGWEKIAETVPGSDVDYVDFNSLDINTDKVYMMLVNIKNATASSLDLYLFRNGDYTTTNYYIQYFFANASAVGAGRVNSAPVCGVTASGSVTALIYMAKDLDGYFRAKSSTCRENPSAVWYQDIALVSNVTATNVTSIRLSASVSGAIKAGSVLMLFRMRTS